MGQSWGQSMGDKKRYSYKCNDKKMVKNDVNN